MTGLKGRVKWKYLEVWEIDQLQLRDRRRTRIKNRDRRRENLG